MLVTIGRWCGPTQSVIQHAMITPPDLQKVLLCMSTASLLLMRDAMLAQYMLSSCVRLSVRLSQVRVLQRVNADSVSAFKTQLRSMP